uniref:Uncharacterized protein n=1 Tax=Oryza brachyantha TaxID=4533 RepID=J3NA12_ORYBR
MRSDFPSKFNNLTSPAKSFLQVINGVVEQLETNDFSCHIYTLQKPIKTTTFSFSRRLRLK